MKKKVLIILTASLFALFVFLLIGTKLIDVKNSLIGEKVGFFGFNDALLPSRASDTWDKISDLCMYVSMLGFLSVAILGVYQLIKSKKLGQVSVEVYAFAGALVVMVILYALFNVVKIDYKPILIEGKKEASFPSTHILVTSFLSFGAVYVFKEAFKNKKIAYCGYGISALLVVLVFLGRILSMNHWFTDCLSGLVLGAFLFSSVILVSELLKKNFTKNKEN